MVMVYNDDYSCKNISIFCLVFNTLLFTQFQCIDFSIPLIVGKTFTNLDVLISLNNLLN